MVAECNSRQIHADVLNWLTLAALTLIVSLMWTYWQQANIYFRMHTPKTQLYIIKVWFMRTIVYSKKMSWFYFLHFMKRVYCRKRPHLLVIRHDLSISSPFVPISSSVYPLSPIGLTCITKRRIKTLMNIHCIVEIVHTLVKRAHTLVERSWQYSHFCLTCIPAWIVQQRLNSGRIRPFFPSGRGLFRVNMC